MKGLIQHIALFASAVLLAGCACSNVPSLNQKEEPAINYLVLVNKLNPLPETWEEEIETVTVTNSLGREIEVEKTAYEAYLKLKEDLEQRGIFVDLDSVRRSVAEQQRIMDDFTAEYGSDYAAKYVAVPGYSEHHTGLALDIYLIIDGKEVYENEEMKTYTDIWETIHERMPEYGFILRYMPGKEHITGYGYEPWHLRYVGVDAAKEVTEKSMTLEGYLGAVNETDVTIDYGTSELYTKEEMDEVIVQIKCRFAEWEGCELHSIRYAGDECCTEENLGWMNSLKEGADYVKVIAFLMDFHSPKEQIGAWEADHEYKDYQWWLAAGQDGSWDIVTWGY